MSFQETLLDYPLGVHYLTYEDAIEYTYKKVNKFIDDVNADQHLKVRWKKLNKMYKEAFLSPHKIHLFKTCTGSGKTVTSVLWTKILSRLSDNINGFVVLSSEYEHGTNEIERIMDNFGEKEEYIKFEGKNRLCMHLDYEINNRGTKIKDLMESGISIKKFCEESCGDKKECAYMCNCSALLTPADKGGIQNWIGVSHQMSNFLPIYLKKSGKIILVVDEDFTNAIKVHNIYGVPVLRKNIEFLEMVKEEVKQEVEELDDIDIFFELISYFHEMLTLLLNSLYDFTNDMDYKKIQEIMEDIDLVKGNSNYYINKINKYAFEFVRDNKIKAFPFIFNNLSNFIDNYENENPIENYEFIDEWIKSAFYRKRDKFEITFLYYDKFSLKRLFNKEKIDKVIINDATADKDILSYVINEEQIVIEHNENWLYQKCKVYQLKKRKNHGNEVYAQYPKSSFLYRATFFHLMKDLEVILNRHKEEPVLTVAREIKGEKLPFTGYMSLSDHIYTLDHDKIYFEDYPLAGTNVYSDVNVVVILGKPDLPAAVVKRQSVLFGMPAEIYRKIYSNSLITQAIGRILRGVEQKYIYLITGFDLEIDMNIIKFSNHAELRNRIGNFPILNQIYDFLRNNNNRITANDLSTMLDIGYQTALNKLNRFVEEGYLLVKRENHGRKIFYKPA